MIGKIHELRIFINYHSVAFEGRIRYVLQYIESHFHTKNKIEFVFESGGKFDIQLDYGIVNGGDFYMPAQQLFFNGRTELTDLISNQYLSKKHTVYSVENRKYQKRKFIRDGAFAFDILETIFFHISRFEEYFSIQKKRIKADATASQFYFLVNNGLEQIPVVDQLIFVFCRALGLEIKPSNTSYAISHDVDKIYKYNNIMDGIKAIVWPLIFRGDLLSAWRNMRIYLKVVLRKHKDPYDTFDWLFNMSSHWQDKTVYFMAGGKTSYDLYDKYYFNSIKKIINKAVRAGYTIGLHPSFNTANDFQMMMDEKQNLEQLTDKIIDKTRQHFLHFFPDKTADLIEKVGFKTDSTLSFNRIIGFRCGTGFKYKLYNFKREKAFEFYEQPLVFMDSSLIHQAKDDMDTFDKILFAFLEKNRTLTQITFNFHNSTFDNSLKHRQGLKDIYEKLVSYVTNNYMKIK